MQVIAGANLTLPRRFEPVAIPLSIASVGRPDVGWDAGNPESIARAHAVRACSAISYAAASCAADGGDQGASHNQRLSCA